MKTTSGRCRRTSGAVVSLAAWRAGLRARDFLVGTLHGAPWLLRAVVKVTPGGKARVVLETAPLSDRAKKCLPRKVEGVAIHVREVA